MQVVHARCCGLDVHKKTVIACVLLTHPNGHVEREVRTFGTMTADLLALSDWVSSLQVRQIALESTGVFWRPIFNVLEDDERTLVLVSPLHMRAGRYDVRAGTLIGTILCFLLLNLGLFTLLTLVHNSRWEVHQCAREDQEPRSRSHAQGVTITVAAIEGWIVQVMWNVPAFGKTIVFLSPPWKVTPPALLRSLGAPLAAANWPPVPITRSCGPPAESSKVTASPALMVILVLPEKTPDPIVIVELLELPLDELPLEQAAKTSARSRMQARTASGARRVICPRDVCGSGVR
jgi:Transposase